MLKRKILLPILFVSLLELNQRFRTLQRDSTNLKVHSCKLKEPLINDRLTVSSVSWNFTFKLFVILHLFTRKRRHTKFYYEDTPQNPKMYTQANKQKNMGSKYLFYQFCFSFLSSLELNQRNRIVRHDIPGVIN